MARLSYCSLILKKITFVLGFMLCATGVVSMSTIGKLGLTATLYLIGTGISRATVRQVGARPMLRGVLLWIVVATTSLWPISARWISL